MLYLLQDFTPRAIIILHHNTTIQCLQSFAWEGMNYYLLYFVYICYYLNEYPKLFNKAYFKNVECTQHCICKSHPAGKNGTYIGGEEAIFTALFINALNRIVWLEGY